MWLEKSSLKPDFLDFLSHLEELRGRLIVCLLVFLVSSAAAYFFSSSLLNFLTAPLHQFDQVQLYFQKPYEAFMVHLTVAALTGFILSSPVLLVQLWLFTAPGLYEKEKAAFLPLISVSIFLFFAGALFAYFLVIPWGLHFLLSYQTESLKPMLSVSSYFSFLVGMIIGFGVLFDFPVFLIGLVRLGLVKTKTLAKSRKTITVLIFIAAAVLTPSPDPLSQVLLALPLLGLFEISLFAARFIEDGRLKNAQN